MPLWTTTPASSRTTLGQVSKVRMTTIKLKANGLMPNSTYTFWCNGVDMTWACRTEGTRQGSGLVSDDTGSMIVLYSAEIVADYNSGAAESTKYSSMQLKDINGVVHSFSIAAQTLIGK